MGVSAGFSVKVQGQEELIALLGRMQKAAPYQTKEAVAKAAVDVQKYAKQNITAVGAVDTGLTRANINQWSADG